MEGDCVREGNIEDPGAVLLVTVFVLLGAGFMYFRTKFLISVKFSSSFCSSADRITSEDCKLEFCRRDSERISRHRVDAKNS